MTYNAAVAAMPEVLKVFGDDWNDPKVEDIFVVRPGEFFVRRGGKTERREAPHLDALAVEAIGALAGHMRGQYADEDNPILDCELPSGERLNLVLAPCTPPGRPSLALRRGMGDLVDLEFLDRQGLWDRIKEIADGQATDYHAQRMEHARNLIKAKKVTEFFKFCVQCRWSIALVGETGSGKAQPLDSSILTPHGWKKMGDMQVGDVITCPSGRFSRITAIHPQGEKEIFKITFSDGRIVECCEDHLWKVWHWKVQYETGKTHETRQVANKGAEWRILPLREIKSWFDRGSQKARRAAVPLIEPTAVEFFPHSGMLPPYVLGAMLGDGHFGETTFYMCSADNHIIDRITDEYEDYDLIRKEDSYNYYFRQKIRKKTGDLFSAVRELGLSGTRSHTKFIPEIYKSGSIEQRLQLMQGLMDTDGSVGNGTHATFTSTSYQLACDVQEVAWSLGAIAKINNRQTYYTYNGEKLAGKPSYRVSIVHPNVSIFFSLPRKLAECTPKEMRHRLTIKSIESVGMKEAQCISIDDKEHLYITDNYVITHNSLNLSAIVMEIPQTPEERIITIGDSEELSKIPHPNKVSFLYTDNGPVRAETLIKAGLRNLPRWQIVQELRDGAAFAYLRGLIVSPGITTWHAMSILSAFDALLVMVMMHESGKAIPMDMLKKMMGTLINVVVHVERDPVNKKFRATDIKFGSELI